MSERNKILVTGGAGFVGSHLCEALAADPQNDVVSLDNYFTGSRDNHVDGVTYLEGHTADIATLVSEPPQRVFHLGEYSRVEQSFAEPERVWDLNCRGTQAVVEYCRQHEAKLIYAGSSTKFAAGEPGRDQSPYAWTKATNADLIVNYGTWFGLEYAICYFYNVYGPREIAEGTYATVLGIFRAQHAAGKPLTVREPGTQRRNFTHVADIVAGLLLIGDRGQGDGYGLGAEDEYSILELAEMFGSDTVMLPGRPGNRSAAALDTSRSSELGWKATRTVRSYVDAARGAG